MRFGFYVGLMVKAKSQKKWSLDDFVELRMSKEPAGDFLRMQDEKIEDYLPLFIKYTSSNINGALRRLGEKALREDCKYVCNLEIKIAQGYSYITQNDHNGEIHYHHERPTRVTVFGTGLIQRTKKNRLQS